MSIMFLNIRKISVSVSSYSGLIDYYGREEAVNPEKIVTDETRALQFDREFERADEIIEYYGRFRDAENTEPGFDFKGSKSIAQAIHEMEQFQPKELYQSIISFTADDAKRLGLGNQNDFKRIADAYVLSCSRQLKISRSNIVWGGYLHLNTKSPHMHIYLFDKTRPELPLLKKRELYTVRSSLGNAIMSQVDSYIEKDASYKKVVEEVKMMFKEKKLDQLIGSRTILGHHKLMDLSEHDKKVVFELKALALSIPLTGKKSALIIEKYHPISQNHLEKVTELLLEESNGSKEYQSILREVKENFEVLYGDKEKAATYVEQQMEKLNRRVSNEIIRFVIKEREVLLHPDFKMSDAPVSFVRTLNDLQGSMKQQFSLGLQQFLYTKQVHEGKDREVEEYEDEVNS